jgi:hypothetical protein
MDRQPRSLHPQLEGFESRELLSTGSGAMAAVGHSPARYLSLDGTLHGHYVVVSPLPDAGTTYRAIGSGRVSDLGRASLKGTMKSIGFIAQGVAQGDITLARPRGKITLHLTGVPQFGGPQGLPSVFTFGITAATGKFKGDHGYGSATLTMVPRTSSVGIQPGQSGTFTLVLSTRVLPL